LTEKIKKCIFFKLNEPVIQPI